MNCDLRLTIWLRRAGLALALLSTLNIQLSTAFAFEGRITAAVTRGGETETLLYTVGTNQLRIARGETDRPYPKNIVNLDTGDITLLFPHNRSFVRLKPAAENQSAAPPGFPTMPPPPGGFPPGMGPQAGTMPGTPAMSPPGMSSMPGMSPSATIGPTNLPGMPAMPPMPQRPQMVQMPQMPPGVGPQAGTDVPNMPTMPPMPMMPPMMGKMELKATTDTTNLLGYTCTRYELKQRGEVMEIWATDKLLPFQPYLQNQPHRFGPRMIEEQWGGMLKAEKLFPLLAVLRFETPTVPSGAKPTVPGPERMRFEVKSITPEKIRDEALFEPPSDYQEIQPLPF